jgi:D-arabinose 1-dehydrogenase-like Zn-dependent alcohol dehydrogenase
LGDVGVQIARAMDTQVAVLDLDDDKHGDALRLGPMRSTSAPIPARSSASPTQEMLDWFRLIRRCTTCACVWCSTVAWSS